MKVVKKSVSKNLELKDFFVKELDGDLYSKFDVVNSFKSEGNSVTVAVDLQDDYICVVIDVFNERYGINGGVRLYEIPLFETKNEKIRVVFPYTQIGLSIIECLEGHNIKFEQLGNGVISDWLMSDDENVMAKLWFSNDFKYMSISRKFMNNEKEEIVSKEELLDRLGL